SVALDTTGLPADLTAMDGQRLAYRQLQDSNNENRIASAIRERLDRGDWRVTRGAADFYRDEVSRAPRPASTRLAPASAEAWPATLAAFPASGYSVAAAEGRPAIVIWRVAGAQLAMGAGFVGDLIQVGTNSNGVWQLSDAEDRVLVGSASIAPAGIPVSRVV